MSKAATAHLSLSLSLSLSMPISVYEIAHVTKQQQGGVYVRVCVCVNVRRE